MTVVTESKARMGQTAKPARAGGVQGSLGRVACGFFFLLPICAVAVPRAVVVLLVGAAVLAALVAGPKVWSTARQGLWTYLDPRLVLALSALILWCAAASLWGFDPPRALLLVLRLSCLFAAALAIHVLLTAADAATRRRLGQFLTAGICVALALAAFEILFGFPIGHFKNSTQDYAPADSLWLNRGATALSILVWPAAGHLWRRGAKGAALALPTVALGALAFLDSLAAILALLFAGLIVSAVLLWPRSGRSLLIAATLAATIGSPIAAHQLYAWDWQDSEWLPFSAQHRVEIWHATANSAVEKPLVGWGFDTSRDLARIAKTPDPSGRMPGALHPHNAPLQILVELGLVGMLIALGLVWTLIQGIERLPDRDRPFAGGAYAASLVVACTAFGLWQNQWIALLACTAVVVAALARARSDLPEDRDQVGDRP